VERLEKIAMPEKNLGKGIPIRYILNKITTWWSLSGIPEVKPGILLIFFRGALFYNKYNESRIQRCARNPINPS
jgi:hypothetical protein